MSAVINGSIVGWAHSPFGKLTDDDLESLIARVAQGAIADAGITPNEIDSIFVGNFNSGFSKQDFPSSLVSPTTSPYSPAPAARVLPHPSPAARPACAPGSLPNPRTQRGSPGLR